MQVIIHAGRLIVALGLLGGCGIARAQATGQQAQNQAAVNSEADAVRPADHTTHAAASPLPLDEQKSAPVQVMTRRYDLDKLTHEPTVPPLVFRGRILWVQKCAFCHDGLGQPTYKTLGPWLDQDLISNIGDDAIKSLIQNGTSHMPAFRYNLSPSQLDYLLGFLKTVPAKDKPTPAQLAGRGEGASSD